MCQSWWLVKRWQLFFHRTQSKKDSFCCCCVGCCCHFLVRQNIIICWNDCSLCRDWTRSLRIKSVFSISVWSLNMSSAATMLLRTSTRCFARRALAGAWTRSPAVAKAATSSFSSVAVDSSAAGLSHSLTTLDEHFNPTEDHAALRDMLRAFVEKEVSKACIALGLLSSKFSSWCRANVDTPASLHQSTVNLTSSLWYISCFVFCHETGRTTSRTL